MSDRPAPSTDAPDPGARPHGGAAAVVWAAAVLLALLHQDFWWWDDRTLIMGFLPIGLGYHALFSLAAAGVWVLAVRFAWPRHIEQWADETPPPAGGQRA